MNSFEYELKSKRNIHIHRDVKCITFLIIIIMKTYLNETLNNYLYMA